MFRPTGLACRAAAALLVGWLAASQALGEDRFPQPQFQSGHVLPRLTTPAPRAAGMGAVDAVLLAAALAAAAWVALKSRSRLQMAVLSVACLAYFGFVRRGCICSVGSVQNVALALADPDYAIPAVAVAFFVLPLVFALFFGRVFCAAVCPLGAAQDLVIVRPLRVPGWLLQALRPLPWIYMAAAVLLAATGAGFVICRFDPFVGFFRLGANAEMLILGGFMLALGTVLARPYCRFLCPYGALLGALSSLSARHATITPDECVRCRLCEDACPFGAIRMPTPESVPESRAAGIRRLAMLLVLLPVFVIGGFLLGRRAGDPVAAWCHPDVRLLAQLEREDAAGAAGTTTESAAFRESRTPIAQLRENAADATRRFVAGGGWVGAFLGLVFGERLLSLSVRRTRKDYAPDRFSCLSCARCFRSCPKEWQRLRRRDGSGSRSDGTEPVPPGEPSDGRSPPEGRPACRPETGLPHAR